MDSFVAVIGEFGIDGMAEILGIPESHARTMKARDSIPPTYFKKLVDAASNREVEGVTFDLLYRLHDKARARRPTPSEQRAAS